jgi:hypothetical protein
MAFFLNQLKSTAENSNREDRFATVMDTAACTSEEKAPVRPCTADRRWCQAQQLRGETTPLERGATNGSDPDCQCSGAPISAGVCHHPSSCQHSAQPPLSASFRDYWKYPQVEHRCYSRTRLCDGLKAETRSDTNTNTVSASPD